MKQNIEIREYCLFPKYGTATHVKSIFVDNENTNTYTFVGDNHFCNKPESKLMIEFQLMKSGKFGKINPGWDNCETIKIHPLKFRAEDIISVSKKLDKVTDYISPIYSASGHFFESEEDAIKHAKENARTGIYTQWSKLIDYQSGQVIKDSVLIAWCKYGYTLYADFSFLKS